MMLPQMVHLRGNCGDATIQTVMAERIVREKRCPQFLPGPAVTAPGR
ncbi:MAG: hypothetical protein RMJ19_05555 [Gemmatales bacterium]|nr:hypothetical protein [Gemmatales bacterium]MDW8175119.1 hypothetical protein [Gemmatales bacterium]